MNRKSGKKLFRAGAWLLPLTALVACTQDAGMPSVPPAANAAAQTLPAVLPDSKRLESRLTGEASESESAQSAAFAKLLADANADAFAALFAQARHPAGKIYALTGLHQTDPAAYGRLKKQLDGASQIEILDGDIVLPYRAADLLPAIEDGRLLCFITEARPAGGAGALLPPFSEISR